MLFIWIVIKSIFSLMCALCLSLRIVLLQVGTLFLFILKIISADLWVVGSSPVQRGIKRWHQVPLNVLIHWISIRHLQQLDPHYSDFVLAWLPRLRCGAWSSILQHRLWSLCHSGKEGSRHGWGFFSNNMRYSSLAVRFCYSCGLAIIAIRIYSADD